MRWWRAGAAPPLARAREPGAGRGRGLGLFCEIKMKRLVSYDDSDSEDERVSPPGPLTRPLPKPLVDYDEDHNDFEERTAVQSKIVNLLQKKASSKLPSLHHRKDFRNPSLYRKLVQFCDLDEFGTNYPEDLYDTKEWTEESFLITLKLI